MKIITYAFLKFRRKLFWVNSGCEKVPQVLQPLPGVEQGSAKWVGCPVREQQDKRWHKTQRPSSWNDPLSLRWTSPWSPCWMDLNSCWTSPTPFLLICVEGLKYRCWLSYQHVTILTMHPPIIDPINAIRTVTVTVTAVNRNFERVEPYQYWN